MKPPSDRRRITVLLATLAAIVGADLALGAAHPYWALAVTAAILAVSSMAYPSPMWLRFRDFCRWIPWALDGKRRKPAATAIPEDPDDAAQRQSYGLDLAEYDARILIGMPLGHLERLAYNLEGPTLALDRSERGRNAGQWDEREAQIWPDGEWTGVIEEVRREQGWKQ